MYHGLILDLRWESVSYIIITYIIIYIAIYVASDRAVATYIAKVTIISYMQFDISVYVVAVVTHSQRRRKQIVLLDYRAIHIQKSPDT